MTLQEIEVFLTVVRTGSISAAAQNLYITQPAVSRHLHALERELDCMLLNRQRGQRQIELTERGREFVPAAEKLRRAWQEAMEVSGGDGRPSLRISSVGSLSSYLLPDVFRTFLARRPECSLVFHQQSSAGSYEMVARGEMDLALITDDMYHAQVETIPLFREPMVLLAGENSGLSGRLHPTRLDPAKEVRLPWNPEYDLWHSFWFQSGSKPRIVVNQMSLLEEVFRWSGDWNDSWAIAPILVAGMIAERTGARVCELEDGPPEEIIYYLRRAKGKPELEAEFLACLKEALRSVPEIAIYE